MSKPNKISTRAKLRLNYYRLRLQVSKFFDRFSREKPADRKGRRKEGSDDELNEETSFSEPPFPIANSVNSSNIHISSPTIISQHHEPEKRLDAFNELGSDFCPSRITVRMESSYILQGSYNNQEQISNLLKKSSRHPRVRAVSSDESLRERNHEVHQKRRSSWTRNRHARDPLDTGSVNGDQPQDYAEDDKDDKAHSEDQEGSASVAILIPEPFVHSPEVPPRELFIPGRESQPHHPVSSYSPFREMRFAQPKPTVMSEIRPRPIPMQPQQSNQSPALLGTSLPKSILKQPYKQPIRQTQPKSILKKPPLQPPVIRAIGPRSFLMQPESILYHIPTPSAVIEDMDAEESNETIPKGKWSLRRLRAKFAALTNRSREPSVFEKEPREVPFGIRFVYQTEPVRRRDIERARKKAEKAEARANGIECDDADADDYTPGPLVSAFLARFIPRWLIDEGQPTSTDMTYNKKDRFQGISRDYTKMMTTALSQRRPMASYNMQSKRLQPHKPHVERNPWLSWGKKIGQIGMSGIHSQRGFPQHDLRPQNYEVYGQTTTENTGTIGGNGRTSTALLVYQPKPKFTFQFNSLLNKGN